MTLVMVMQPLNSMAGEIKKRPERRLFIDYLAERVTLSLDAITLVKSQFWAATNAWESGDREC